MRTFSFRPCKDGPAICISEEQEAKLLAALRKRDRRRLDQTQAMRCLIMTHMYNANMVPGVRARRACWPAFARTLPKWVQKKVSAGKTRSGLSVFYGMLRDSRRYANFWAAKTTLAVKGPNVVDDS